MDRGWTRFLAGAAGGAAAVVITQRLRIRKASPYVIVVCGPSGVGKNTLIEAVQLKHPGMFEFCTSHTTRAPRKNEVDGDHYHFVDKKMFEAIKAANGFVESAEVHGNFYGTSKSEIEKVLRTGRNCILDIDTQGADQFFEIAPSFPRPVRFVFVCPPSVEVLEQRLRSRGTETEEVIKKRVKNAAGEIARYSCQTHWRTVVNNDLDQAVQRFEILLT